MSLKAMLWVLDWAPNLAPHLLGTLIALAEQADPDGRGTYPSQARVAWRARKIDRAVRKDLVQLEKLGLIVRGDQALAAHLAADERPVVYDLPLHLQRLARPARDRNHSSGRKGRGTGTTVPVQSQRDRNHSSARDRNPSTDEPSTEPSSSLSPTGTPTARVAAHFGIEEEEAEKIVEKIKSEHRPRSPARYIDALITNGDIDQYRPTVHRPYTGPVCDYTDNPTDPGRCTNCTLPAGNARHRNRRVEELP